MTGDGHRDVSATVWSEMRIVAAFARVPPRLVFWAMAGVALLLSHDAVFLVQLGPGEELTRSLREAGHDYWGWASLGLAVIGLSAALDALLRLRSLRRRADQLRVVLHPPRPALAGRFAVTWARLFIIVVIGFVLQENVEHVANHGHAIGPGALLGPEYPLALPVIGLITAFFGLAVAAAQRTERELLSIISAGLRLLPRRPRHLGRPPRQLVLPRRSPLALSVAGRAPPGAFAARH